MCAAPAGSVHRAYAGRPDQPSRPGTHSKECTPGHATAPGPRDLSGQGSRDSYCPAVDAWLHGAPDITPPRASGVEIQAPAGHVPPAAEAGVPAEEPVDVAAEAPIETAAASGTAS